MNEDQTSTREGKELGRVGLVALGKAHAVTIGGVAIAIAAVVCRSFHISRMRGYNPVPKEGWLQGRGVGWEGWEGWGGLGGPAPPGNGSDGPVWAAVSVSPTAVTEPTRP